MFGPNSPFPFSKALNDKIMFDPYIFIFFPFSHHSTYFEYNRLILDLFLMIFIFILAVLAKLRCQGRHILLKNGIKINKSSYFQWFSSNFN